MKIGKVYANAEREEDRASQTLIEMGAIAGEGLLGVVTKAIGKLVAAAEMAGYFSGDCTNSPGAEDKVEASWVELFAALKAVEIQAEKSSAAIEDARLAMTSGHFVAVPVGVVEKWLAYIEESLS